VFQTAVDGCQWGTVVPQGGSAGDTGRTIAAAKLTVREGEYLLSGEKHFGSGSGMTSFKITTAIPEGESEIESFFMDSNGMDRLAGSWRRSGTVGE
tara:strand:- start:6048 stop:6335 length:288 start_codon:yes stop_codon:yes gene_type:complete